MKRTLILSGLAWLMLGAAGCATRYQALQEGAAISEGYREEKLGENSWRVSFAGNSATPASITYRYALLRCAEIAGEGGFDTFTIDSVETRVDRQGPEPVSVSSMDGGTNGVPSNSFSPDSADPPPKQYVPPSGGSGGWPASTYIRRPETVLVVTAFRGEDAARSSNVFTVKSFEPELRRLPPHAP
jgi:hypothetical protein